MVVDEIECKFPRIRKANGVRTSQSMDDQYPDEEEGEKNKRSSTNAAMDNGGALDLCGGLGRFYGFPPSRIVRVSRASGGKDRHSKVLTSKGLRDRRVRLSVNTAIQFYDLQDRLGFDQPSKAVEWLLKAAESSIAELPPMDSLFLDEKMSSTGGSDQLEFGSAELDMEGGQQQGAAAAKSSACSSTSETSKGSGLSLSRSESRIKARKRAKERVAEKEKEKESESSLNAIPQTFTELLNRGINVNNNTTTSPNDDSGTPNESNFFLKSPRQWSSAPMDYFSPGLFGPPAAARSATQMHLAPNSFTSAPFNVSRDHQQEQLQQFFVADHLVPVANTAAGGNSSGNNNNIDSRSDEYNLNFTIASSANLAGLAGFNRGTLQSNSSSPSLFPHLQRFHDGSPPSFFTGTAAQMDNNHHHQQQHQQFLAGYDARLQLYYGDAHANASNGGRHSNQKGKGKN